MRATISTIFTVRGDSLGNFAGSTLLRVVRSLDTGISPLSITLVSSIIFIIVSISVLIISVLTAFISKSHILPLPLFAILYTVCLCAKCSFFWLNVTDEYILYSLRVGLTPYCISLYIYWQNNNLI